MSRSPLHRTALILTYAACFMVALVLIGSPATAGEPTNQDAFKPKSRIGLVDGFWEINGKPTYKGSTAEGLLMNVRMVNAIFHDRNAKTAPKGFDPDANTASFIKKIPDYIEHGVLAFTVNLQGGDPGYEGAENSAFKADGALHPDSMARLARVIEACDAQGAVVIVGCFSSYGSRLLAGEAAVRRGAFNVVDWLQKRGYSNVLLEVADAFADAAYDPTILKDPLRLAGLIGDLKQKAPGLLMSASGAPNGRVNHAVGSASHFILLHFQSVKVADVFRRVTSASKLIKALVCNDDGRTGEAGAQALNAAVEALCSWGYANRPLNEHYPFRFDGAADDPAVYAKLKELTSP